MPSSRDYLQFITEQLSDLEEITYRAIMGEYIMILRLRAECPTIRSIYIPERLVSDIAVFCPFSSVEKSVPTSAKIIYYCSYK